MRKQRELQLCLHALPYFTRRRSRIFGLLIVSGAATCIALLQVWPLAVLVDSVLPSRPKENFAFAALRSMADSPPVQIAILAAAAVLLRVMTELLGLIQTMLRVRVVHDAVYEFRCDLFRKLQSLSLNFHRTRPQGDVLYRLNEDTNSLQTLLSVSIDVASAALTLLVIVLLLMASNMQLTLLALSIMPLLVVINWWFARQMGSRCRAAKELDSQYLFQIQRSMSVIHLIQASCREQSEFGHFQQSAFGRNQAWEDFHRQAAAYRLCVGLAVGASAAAMLGYGGYLVYRDQVVAPQPGGMTAGALVVFLTYLAMLYDPICKLTGASANTQTALAGIERVLEVLHQEPVIREMPGAIRLSQQPRRLVLSNVHFDYGSKQILRGIDVTIEPGEMVAFVGPSGAGKSTLLNLLPRFDDPTQGSLLLDDYDIRTIALNDLRRHIALVLQEGIILPTTIAGNIGYANPTASAADIRAAADAAGASEFIESLPQGYDTILAEGGQNLSGGQRQRIATARAILTNAPVLVFDEPTSSLDSKSERVLVRTFESLKKHRTLVIVSHRLSTIVDCDRIFVLQNGQIVEQGTHQQLLDLGGLYADMAVEQQLYPRVALAAAAA